MGKKRIRGNRSSKTAARHKGDGTPPGAMPSEVAPSRMMRMGDLRLLRLVHELDRVLDGEHVRLRLQEAQVRGDSHLLVDVDDAAVLLDGFERMATLPLRDAHSLLNALRLYHGRAQAVMHGHGTGKAHKAGRK